MEAELTTGDTGDPGVARPRSRASRRWPAARARASAAIAPRQPRVVPHRVRRRRGRQGRLRDLLAHDLDPGGGRGQLRAASAPVQQQRYTDANAETMFSEPATATRRTSSPGRCPRSFPRLRTATHRGHPAEHRPLLDVPVGCSCRPGAATAPRGRWSASSSGTAVHDEGELQVVPQVPSGQPSVAGSGIRLGAGSADVLAARAGRSLYDDGRAASPVPAPSASSGSRCRSARDRGRSRSTAGASAHGSLQVTNRGIELTVDVARGGRDGAPHTLVVTVD